MHSASEGTWLSASDGVMRYSRRGQGKPVVLLHGWCLNSALWTYAEEALVANYDVITPDLAGFGRSAGVGGPYTLDRYANDVTSLLRSAVVANAVLVGFAFGAAVAMAAASKSTQFIERVI